MADDRPLDDPASAIAELRAELADIRSTSNARQYQRPTGDIEIAFRGTPKPGTIFLQGQTLNRADFPDLWAWAQASGSVVAGGYGVGNGGTTFTVPDMRDRVIVGAGGTVALGGTGGSATRTLTQANLPAHGHTGTAASAGSHVHDSGGGEMASAGDHGGHFPGSSFLAAAGGDLGLAAWNSGGGNRGGHNHFFTFDILSAGAHSHTLTINNTGSGEAFDNRPPYLGVNVAVWT